MSHSNAPHTVLGVTAFGSITPLQQYGSSEKIKIVRNTCTSIDVSDTGCKLQSSNESKWMSYCKAYFPYEHDSFYSFV